MLSVEVLLIAFWILSPALVPNVAAVLGGGGRPIDCGQTIRGGRVLGDGKTWRGFFVGTTAGVIVAGVANLANPIIGGLTGINLPTFTIPVALVLAGGAMFGDVIGSFAKRRTGRERGSPVPLVDQLDFVVGAGVLGVVFVPEWMSTVVTLAVAIVIVLGTPLIHLSANMVAYKLDVKHEPW